MPAHLMNFGGFATPERNIFFDINDFDETLPAPWEWDVKRLAASIVIAARHIDLPDSAGATAATESVCSYRERMADYASMRALDVWYDRIDLDREQGASRTGSDHHDSAASSHNRLPDCWSYRTCGHRHVGTRRARADDKGYGFSCGRDDPAPRAHRRGAEHAV